MQRWLTQLATLFGATTTLWATVYPAPAQVIQLQDGNSSVRLNFRPSTPASVGSLELTNQGDEWRVEGTDHLFVEDFFFSFKSHPHQPSVSLGSFFWLSQDQPSANRASLLFANFDHQLGVLFETSLTGGAIGSSLSTRRETLTLYNLNPTDTLELSVFKYVDFDISGSLSPGEYANDTTQFLDDSTLLQTDPSGLQITVTSQQTPDRRAIAPYPTLLTAFNTPAATDLSNSGSPLVNNDGTAAFQFDRTLAPGSVAKVEFTLRFQPQNNAQDDASAIPEPAATSGIMVVILSYLWRTRRQFQS